MKKRFLGLLLTAAMCLSLLPSTALAEEPAVQTQELTEQEQPVAEEQPAKEVPAEETEQEEPVATQEIAEQGIAVQADEGVTTHPDSVNENGDIIKVNSFTRTGPALTEELAKTTLQGQFYVVKEDMTINGDLMIDGSGTTDGGLVLREGVTLTINGALIHNGGSKFYIYGESNNGANTGKLVINNSNGDGAAIRSTASAAQLCISSGELELHGGASKQLVDGVKLYSGSSIHEGILDGSKIPLADWRYKSSILGEKLVIDYCDHDNATYESVTSSTHKKKCADCGFVGTAVACGKDGYERYVSGGADGHYKQCPCGNTFGTLEAHAIKTVPVNSTYHVSGCQSCDYTNGSTGQHTWDKSTGECTECGFAPVAEDAYNNSFESVTDALEAVAKDGGNNYVQLNVSGYTGGSKTEINENIVFNQPGKTIELRMNGHTLEKDSGPVITVEAGTLRITGDAVINQTGETYPDHVASAVVVTGGKLIFEGDLTAHGGTYPYANRTQQNPAVYAGGGELEFNGNLDLKGGLTITGDAKLTKGLTQGTFSVDTGVQNTNRLSVEGAANYTNINSLLAANRAFFDTDREQYLGVSYRSWSGNVTIKAHEHKWAKPASGDNYECTVCGQACSHEGGFKDGACAVCGKPCPHYMATQSQSDYHWYCDECGQQMIASIQTGYTYTFYKDLKTALEAAEDGQTVTLRDDFDQGSQTACLTGDNKTVTLDLNRHTITGGWIHVGWGENWADPVTSSTLEIIGSGSFNGVLSVREKATLDLSDWGGGTSDMIHEVGLSKNGDTQPNLEGLLTVGENAGTINTLAFYNWPSAGIRSTLKGGTYGKIWITTQLDEGEPYSGMLAPGYAFQYTDKDGFVEYTKRAEYTSVNTIENVKVVKCSHKKVENGTCTYCGTTGIKAVLDGTTVYSDIDTALNAWLTSGRELTLYTNSPISGATWVSSGKRVLNLNGYALTGGEVDLARGLDLTIRDTSANGTGKIDNLTVNSGAKLTLESGEIGSLNVESAADGDVKLRGGKVTSSVSDSKVLVYRLLEDGYYLKGSALLAKFSGGPYEVKSANITVGGEKTGKIAIGKNIVNIPVSLTLPANTSTTAVQFDWYLVGTNKNDLSKSKLASVEVAVTDGVAAYDPTTANASMDAGWDSLVKDMDYTLVCMATDTAADRNVSWQAALNGYTLHMLPPSIEDAKIIAGSNNNTGIPGCYTVYPGMMGSSAEAQTLTLDFAVRIEGQTLERDTDYIVLDESDKGANAGKYTLKIQGIGNYSGTLEFPWEIIPHKLNSPEINTITRPYDGKTEVASALLGIEKFGSKADMGLFDVSMTEDKDYRIVSATMDSADVGDRTLTLVIELLNPNYTFEDGETTGTFQYNQSLTTNVCRIIKTDAPTAEQGTLTVENSTAAEYTFDLASLLPALESPREYGTVTYTVENIDLGEYYNTENSEARIENGKLILPIQSVNTSTTGAIGTVMIKAVSTNYKDIPLTIAVSAENRKTTGGGGSKKHNTPSTPKEEKPSEDTTKEDNTTKENFADVPADAWFKDAVEYVSDNGLMSGVEKDNFAPKVLTNRAMLVTILWRLESCPTGGQTTDFNDIKTSDYFHNAVLWAAENKIVSGVSETNFAPNDSITREQLAAILYRYAVYKGYDVTQGGMAVREFSDYESISDYARGSVAWAVNTGILSGKGENILDPKGVATRAEVASMLMRFCENIAK